MVILFVTSTFAEIANGPAKFANLLLELNTGGDTEVHILTEDAPIDNKNSYVHRIELKETFFRRRFGMLTRSTDYFEAVKDFARKVEKPDVVVFNNAIHGIHTAMKASIPVVGMINDDSSLKASLKNYGFSYRFLRYSVFSFMERLAVQNCNLIILNSNYLMQQFEGAFGGDKFVKLYKAVDIHPAATNVVKSYNGEISLLFVKSDFLRGGLFDLINALNTLTDHSFRLKVVGPSAEMVKSHSGYVPPMSHLHVEYGGRLNQEEVFKQLVSHHIFCTPARLEALGVANMEALIHGTPVIYTNTGGIPEVMNYGGNGFVAEPGNPESLAAAIQSCIETDDQRRIKQTMGAAFIRKHFAKETMLKNFITICRQSISKKNA